MGETPDSETRHGRWQYGVCLAKWGCFGIVCYFVLAYVAAHVDELGNIEWPQFQWVFAASACAAVSFLLFPVCLQLLMKVHGINLAYHRALGLCHVPRLGKYVPGKIWGILSILYLYRREGISQRLGMMCLMLLMTLDVLACALVALIFGWTRLVQFGGIWLVFLIIGGTFMATSPQILYPTLNAVLRRLGRSEIEAELTTSHLLIVFSDLLLCYLFYGTGFACLVKGFADISLETTPYLIGLFAFAQVAGFLALFAPAGVGVREGILIVGLTSIIGAGPAIVISGVCRLWQTVIELVIVGIGWLALRRSRPLDAMALTRPPGTTSADALSPVRKCVKTNA